MNSPSKHTRRTFTGLALVALLLALLWPALSAYALNWLVQTSHTNVDLNGVAYDDRQCQFVVVGAGGRILTSPDGLTWTPQIFGDTTLNGIAYDGDSQLVAVGATGTILTSSDSVTWTVRTSITTTTADLNGVAYGGSRFVAVGDTGTLLTSSDGVTWTAQISGELNLNGVAYGGSQFVAVGASGRILTSPDGVNWKSFDSGSKDLLGIVYDGSRFVAVGSAGAILISYTGQSWTPNDTDTSRWFTSIAYGGSQFVAVTSAGKILTSSDLGTWTSVDAPNALNGAAYGGSQFVAVGRVGLIMTSGGGSCSPTLNLIKSVSPLLATPGQAITYTIAFTNTGAITATNVQITDTLSAYLTNASVISSGAALTQVPGSRYGWTALDLPQNDGGIITITGVLAKPLAAGTLPNTVTLAVSDTVKTANVNLTVLNVAPDADAGLDQNQSVNSIVTLDGRDSTDDNGDALTYGWTQIAGTEVTFARNLSLTTFTAPVSPTVLIFTLTVTDTGFLSDTTDMMGEEAVVTVLPSYTLTVATAGDGTGNVTPATSTYMSGTVVPITATASTDSTFAGWSGDLSGSTTPTTITMDGNKSITAMFNLITYTLAVATAGDGAGSVTPAVGPNSYVSGTVVPITATANTGSAFTGWSGAVLTTTNSTTITMIGNKSITATFTLKTYTLTVAIAGNGAGSVIPDVGTYSYTYGTVVPITATANAGSAFTGWSGADVTTTNPITITMTGDKSITATFKTYKLWLPIVLRN